MRKIWTLIGLVIFCIGCVYFGCIRRQTISDRCSLYELARKEVLVDIQWLTDKDAYWSVFDPTASELSHDRVIQTLLHDATIHQATWTDSDGDPTEVYYYCDKHNRCLNVSYVELKGEARIVPFGMWYFVNDRGLVQFDWVKLVGNIWFALAVFVLPIILLIKAILFA